MLLVIISNFSFSISPLGDWHGSGGMSSQLCFYDLQWRKVEFTLRLYFVNGISIFLYNIAKLELTWALREITEILPHFMKKKRKVDFFFLFLYMFFTLHISLDCSTLSQSHVKTALCSAFYKNTAEICSPVCFQSNLDTLIHLLIRSLTCLYSCSP